MLMTKDEKGIVYVWSLLHGPLKILSFYLDSFFLLSIFSGIFFPHPNGGESKSENSKVSVFNSFFMPASVTFCTVMICLQTVSFTEIFLLLNLATFLVPSVYGKGGQVNFMQR